MQRERIMLPQTLYVTHFETTRLGCFKRGRELERILPSGKTYRSKNVGPSPTGASDHGNAVVQEDAAWFKQVRTFSPKLSSRIVFKK